MSLWHADDKTHDDGDYTSAILLAVFFALKNQFVSHKYILPKLCVTKFGRLFLALKKFIATYSSSKKTKTNRHTLTGIHP